MDLKVLGYKVEDWICLSLVRIQCVSMKGGEFLDQLSEYQLLKYST
jgi:hypothetical protein